MSVAVVAVAAVSVAIVTVAVVAMVIVAVVVFVACAADAICVPQGSPRTHFRTGFGETLCNINRPARETIFCQKFPRSLVPR